jgi:hypothetical protein
LLDDREAEKLNKRPRCKSRGFCLGKMPVLTDRQQ